MNLITSSFFLRCLSLWCVLAKEQYAYRVIETVNVEFRGETEMLTLLIWRLGELDQFRGKTEMLTLLI